LNSNTIVFGLVDGAILFGLTVAVLLGVRSRRKSRTSSTPE
jgi:hypothetical protein